MIPKELTSIQNDSKRTNILYLTYQKRFNHAKAQDFTGSSPVLVLLLFFEHL